MIIKKRNSLQIEVSSEIGFNNIFTGYIINVIVVDIGSDKFFDIVFKKELEKVIANSFVLPNAE